jgi:hypothetical protein
MNFKDMREYVSNILDYNPNVDVYRTEVNNVLNQVYVTHFTERPWEYAQREYDIEVLADQTFTGNVWTRGVKVNPNSSQGTYGPFMTFEATAAVDDIEANKEYNAISRFDVGSDSYLVLQDPVYQLDQYAITQAMPNNTSTAAISFKMKHRHVNLPPDCIEILGVGLRGRQSGFRQPFFNLAKYEDEHMGLDLDEVGVPTNWVETMPITLPSPRKKPKLVAGVKSNRTITAGDYQVAYTFTVVSTTERGIVEIESSPVFGDVQTFAVNVSLEVADIEVTETYAAQIPTIVFRELRKNIYIKTPDTAHFVRASTITVAPEQDSSNTVLGNGIDFSMPLRFNNQTKLQENEGTYKTFRLYPRQDSDYICKLRYHYRPKILADDQDAPQMPSDAHLFLCYGAIAELFYKHSNTTQGRLYEDKAKRELMKIENKYLTQKDKAHIKQGYRSSDMYFGRPFVRITRVP